MEKITAIQAAKLLGISIEDLGKLEKQGLIHTTHNTEGVSSYSSAEISRMKTRHGLTLAEEAAQVGIEIQQEVFTGVSSLLRSRKTYTILGAVVSSCFLLLFMTFSILFYFYPLQTSDFFGYYYRFNSAKQQASLSSEKEGNVLAASTGPGVVSTKTSILADIIKPVAAMSLVAVKAVDSQKYTQIVTNPVEASALSAPTGTSLPGINGTISNDATIDSSGVLTLKSVGTPGSYGSATLIPVITTDTQGRVSGVTNTAISGLTNANLSGTAGITNANLANSSVSLAGNSGSGIVSLGGTLTVTGAGITNITASGSTLTITSTEADTLASVTGRGATTATALTLSSLSNAITAGTLTATGGTINGTTIGATSPSTGVFTTINGLTITNNGTNTLTIAAGKTLTVNSSITFGGTDGTTFTLPAASDTLIGRTSTDTLTNKTLSASTNTISGLTNTNLSGLAGITNANLANSSATVTAGTGLSGGGTVSLGGSVSLTNAGVLSLTGTTNQVTVSASTGTITLTLPQDIHTGASPTFAGLTLSSLTSCGALATNSSGVLVCNGATGDTATFSDTTPATIADNDTTELFNDATKPSITPNIATQTVLVTVHMSFTGGGGVDTYPVVRIVRNNGSAASCSTSSQVGDTFGTFMTTPDRADATGTFLDSPNTTGQVFYTVCSSANSNLGGVPVSNRIDVTLVELGADLAENYYTKDDSIEAGDVVAIDSSLPAGVRKSSKQYDNQVIGVISTNPGKVLDDAIGLNFGRAVPVALSGRVPVKVSTENGSIKPGDPLTSSGVPGVAMKATKAGYILGIAIATYEGDRVGNVMTFVNNAYFNGISEDNSIIDEASGSADLTNIESVIETTMLDQIIQAVSEVFKKTVEFFGNVIFHADVTFLGRLTFNKDTAGHALIKQGESEVSVIFEKEYAQNPVVTANVNLTGGVKADEIPMYAVYDLGAKGFKIKLSKATPFDLNFSWIALAVNGDNTSTSNVSGTPLLSPIPTVIPSATPSPSPEIAPSQTATQSASPSAQVVP